MRIVNSNSYMENKILNMQIKKKIENNESTNDFLNNYLILYPDLHMKNRNADNLNSSYDDYFKTYIKSNADDNELLSTNPLIKARQEHLEKISIALENYDKMKKEFDKANECMKKIEEKEREIKRQRTRRMNDLKSLITHYKSKCSLDKNDKNSQAMLDMYKTKLYWVMYG